MWGEVRVGTRGVAAAQAACTGGARLKRCGGQGMRGAHGEHAAHVLDTGRVEAQRLVKHPRVLPRVERRAYGAGQGAGWGAGGPGAAAAQAACTRGGLDWTLGQGTRGAHSEHAAHVRDTGRVEGQRLVEGPRVLPSRKEGMA